MSFLRPLALVALTASLSLAAAEPAKISGTATYRERIALEPGTVLEVELLDVSLMDAAAIRLSLMRVKPETQVPIAFSLYYDPALIEENHTYSLSARLISGNRTIFRSDSLHPVLTRGAGDTVEIQMVRTQVMPTPAAGLVGPEWIAVEIAGQAAADDPKSTITFTAEGRAFGSGGCNSFNGNYTADGNSFGIGNLATTLRACAEPILTQEQRFHQALRDARSFRIESGELILSDEGGTAVLRLKPRA